MVERPLSDGTPVSPDDEEQRRDGHQGEDGVEERRDTNSDVDVGGTLRIGRFGVSLREGARVQRGEKDVQG